MAKKNKTIVDSPADKKAEKYELSEQESGIDVVKREESAEEDAVYDYAGVHQFADGSFRLEAVSGFWKDVVRYLYRLYKNSGHPIRMKDIYEDTQAPEKGECFFVCRIRFDLSREIDEEFHIFRWRKPEDCVDLPLSLISTGDGKEVTYAEAGGWDRDDDLGWVLAVNKKTLEVAGIGNNPLNAYYNYLERDTGDDLTLDDLAFCGASNEFFDEAIRLRFGIRYIM